MVAMGALAQLTGAFSLNNVGEILKKYFTYQKQQYVPLNVQAIEAGAKAVI
jgi:Pyruvate/2-oxoacid:ferredoxin oxidoreductase gamma subunit